MPGCIRLFLLFASCSLASIAGAAPLDGRFVMQSARGPIVANLQVRGERLVGSIDLSGQARINLLGAIQGNAARGSATSTDGSGEFEAEVAGDTLNIVLSQKEARNQKAMSHALVFQREAAATARANAPGDRRIVGHWSYQNLIVSGNASFASEEHLLFKADGSYAYGKGATAAGAGDWSFDGGRGGDLEHGLWRAESGVLFVGDGSRWNRVGTYAFTDDGSTMRIAYDGGGRKIWIRKKP
jgi:hypothetical protein